ncbi:MAG: hypothetical protein ABSF71_11370 [Terriglobia bacterium]|jgi:hypothetical protein
MSNDKASGAARKVQLSTEAATGSFVDLRGERYYRIAHYDAMPPFFMSIVSDSDHWLFISSNGGLTAGRKDPDHALFPYYPDDRIHDASEHTGSKTIIRVIEDGGAALWEPFSAQREGSHQVSRHLYKSVYGNKIIWEEVNHDLALTFSYGWMMSERFGFVRRAQIVNRRDDAVRVELLDGIQNVLPSGVTRRFQAEYSTLVDGYKRTELEPTTGLALFRLSSIPVDKPEPSESLRVNVAWSAGLDAEARLLSSVQLDAFRRGSAVTQETDIHGRRGAYFLRASLTLPACGEKGWKIVAEVDQDAAGVRSILHHLHSPATIVSEIDDGVARGTENLVRIVAAADGLQLTEDEPAIWHHFSSTLFNVMRGGIPNDNYRISRADLKLFIFQANRQLARKHQAFLDGLPELILHRALIERVREQQDADLERLVNEYLPMTFSRRHGDPSRPWNLFEIKVKDDQGRKVLNYQGNWRDIFQNWEALSVSFPGFTEGMIYKFLDSSTADGYNPYRISSTGYDWEIIDPHDPWSFIGYWGDHQVIYLLRLLEQAQGHYPDCLQKLLRRAVFTYANVPYRIKPYASLLEDSRNTITFDRAAHRQAMKRASELGEDGKALLTHDGQLARANLAEKILIVILTKFANYIPEAGIWMNTQRPEWNDANNALVGAGASMVTLYYLRRFLVFTRELISLERTGEIELSAELAALFGQVFGTLESFLPLLNAPLSDRGRKSILDALGNAGSIYRQKIYVQGFSGERSLVPAERVQSFCDHALRHIDHSIQANRRADGLFHSYDLITIAGEEIRIRKLQEMLEGQVAVLSSGALTPAQGVSLLDALRNSSLYRPDQNSYILYPDRPLPRFLEKNNVPQSEVEMSKLLVSMLERDDRRIVVRDGEGGLHFNASFRNAEMLKQALHELRSEFRQLAKKEERQILDLYEKVFDHQSFTGRSGTFYKYEGLGCIYWHMVSKLLLAVREILERAVAAGADESVVQKLRDHYNSVYDGLGVHKSPAVFGAIPTDPYSHTPGFAGAQQPGMTGQVKEDFIARMGEMGVHVENGELAFVPKLMTRAEFLAEPKTFHYCDVEGNQKTLNLERDTIAFTCCQVPVVAHRSGPQHIRVTFGDGMLQLVGGLKLDAATSAAIFDRLGTIRSLEVFYGLA